MKIINGQRHYTTSETAAIVGVTRATLIRWYEYQDTIDVKVLPDYIRVGGHNTKYWSEENIDKIVQFKKSKKQGDMALISSKYNGVRK